MYDMVFGYRKVLWILTFVDSILLIINTQNDAYAQEFMILSYPSDKIFESIHTFDYNGTSTSVKKYWNRLFDSELVDDRNCSKYEIRNLYNKSKHKWFSTPLKSLLE